MNWSDRFLHALKQNDVRFVTYVPDNVLAPLIGGAEADNYFMTLGATREDEAVGTLAGAYMGGPARRGNDADQLCAHLYAAGHRPQNFYMLGSMGLAGPIALGVAIAQPERGVIALEGDGSILMALGCLATIGMVRPRNLTIVIMDNGIYQITGKQKAATASTADIVAIARGAGIANSHWVRDAAHFDELTSRAFDADVPALLTAKIDEAPGTGQTVRDPRAWHRPRQRAGRQRRPLALLE